MKLPILKYYLGSALSLKLRFYFVDREGFCIQKVSMEASDRACTECLIYAATDACDSRLLSSVHRVLRWLLTYLSGSHPKESLPLLLSSSSADNVFVDNVFAHKVLQELLHVPFGTRISYKELASRIGHPKAARAVGNALHNNPLPLIIPCHRIVCSTGKIGGFAYPISLKELLLNFESSSLI